MIVTARHRVAVKWDDVCTLSFSLSCRRHVLSILEMFPPLHSPSFEVLPSGSGVLGTLNSKGLPALLSG